MTRSRILFWLAWSLALAAILTAWSAACRSREIAQTLDAARSIHASLQRRVTLTEERREVIKDNERVIHKPVGFGTAAGPLPIADATAQFPIRTSAIIRSSNVDPQILAATDPNLRALHLRAHAADLEGIWGPLLKQLNLPSDKLERFKAILMGHEERRLDVTAVAGEKKLELSDPAIQKLRDADGSQLSREMRALLGPELMAVYQPYRRSLEVQPVVADVVAATYFTPTPLTAEQSLRLWEILANNSERRPNGFVAGNTLRWDVVLDQTVASGVFSPAAIDALQRIAAQRDAETKTAEKWSELVRKNTGKSEINGLWLPGVSLRP